jgi:hypothetical protein
MNKGDVAGPACRQGPGSATSSNGYRGKWQFPDFIDRRSRPVHPDVSGTAAHQRPSPAALLPENMTQTPTKTSSTADAE